MSKPTILILARPAESAAWEPALRARGLDVVVAASRKEARQAAVRAAPAAVVVSDRLPFAGALRATRDLRLDPATREVPVVLAGAAPFTLSQRLRLGAAAPDATAPKRASAEQVAEAVVEALRTGKLPAPELTEAQQKAQKYVRLANLLMIMGLLFAFPILPGGPGAQRGDRSWFAELIPLGGLVADIATGRLDGRKRWLSWQGWAAIGFMGVVALGILLWPSFFRLR